MVHIAMEATLAGTTTNTLDNACGLIIKDVAATATDTSLMRNARLNASEGIIEVSPSSQIEQLDRGLGGVI